MLHKCHATHNKCNKRRRIMSKTTSILIPPTNIAAIYISILNTEYLNFLNFKSIFFFLVCLLCERMSACLPACHKIFKWFLYSFFILQLAFLLLVLLEYDVFFFCFFFLFSIFVNFISCGVAKVLKIDKVLLDNNECELLFWVV